MIEKYWFFNNLIVLKVSETIKLLKNIGFLII